MRYHNQIGKRYVILQIHILAVSNPEFMYMIKNQLLDISFL